MSTNTVTENGRQNAFSFTQGDASVIHTLADYQVYWTDEYNMFRLASTNRDVRESYVRSLMNSMRKHGFLVHEHIVVDPDGVVIDGQHRLTAAANLEIQVPYSVYEDEYTTELVVDMNMRQEKWKLEDFVLRFVEMGDPNYEAYNDFVEQYEFPYSVPAYMLGTTTRQVKTGNVDWPDDDQTFHDVANVVTSVREQARNTIAHKKPFILAVGKVLGNTLATADELARKAGNAAADDRIRNHTNVQDYVYDLVNAWNYHRPEKSDDYIGLF